MVGVLRSTANRPRNDVMTLTRKSSQKVAEAGLVPEPAEFTGHLGSRADLSGLCIYPAGVLPLAMGVLSTPSVSLFYAPGVLIGCVVVGAGTLRGESLLLLS